MEEYALVTKLIIYCAFLLLLMSAIIIITSTLFKKRIEEMALEKELERQKNQLQQLEAILSAQESERKSIADDLHDEVGATLSLVQKNLSYIQKNQDSRNPFDAELSQSIQLVDYSIQAIRGISKELIPNNVLQLGLIKGIEQQLKLTENKPFRSCQFHSEVPNEFDFDQVRAVEIYRVFMELLNNIVKHGNASSLNIDCHISENQFILTFSHNGNTFTDDDYANNLANSNGLGLKSVANRLKRLDAKIHFESKRKIAEIKVIVPLNEIFAA